MKYFDLRLITYKVFFYYTSFLVGLSISNIVFFNNDYISLFILGSSTVLYIYFIVDYIVKKNNDKYIRKLLEDEKTVQVSARSSE